LISDYIDILKLDSRSAYHWFTVIPIGLCSKDLKKVRKGKEPREFSQEAIAVRSFLPYFFCSPLLVSVAVVLYAMCVRRKLERSAKKESGEWESVPVFAHVPFTLLLCAC